MKRIVLLLLIAITAFSSCKKNKNECTSSGIVNFTGEVGADGCDWVIKINGTDYHPEKLDIGYKQDNLTMYMDYELTGDTFLCGWGNQLPVIRFTCKYWPEY